MKRQRELNDRITVRFSEEDALELELRARDGGRTASQEIRLAVKRHLEAERQKA